MPYTTVGKNTMLNALTPSHVSVHTSFPGDSGANEVSGGAFARQAITFGAASSGARDSQTQPIFDIPPLTEFMFWSAWTAASGGQCLGYGAVGGQEIPYSVDPALNLIQAVAHGLSGGDRVVLMGAAPPTGLSEGQVYYVVNATADDFQVSATLGGAAINITGGSAAAILSSVEVQSAGAAGGQFTLPDADLYV